MSIPDQRTPVPEAPSAPLVSALRLVRRDTEFHEGCVHGGWWPYSQDLAAELMPLLKELFTKGYDVRRVMYSSRSWDRAPRRITVDGRDIMLAGYYTQHSSSIVLFDRSGLKHLDLVVVPPNTGTPVADRAMALAGRDGDLHRAAEILDEAAAPRL